MFRFSVELLKIFFVWSLLKHFIGIFLSKLTLNEFHRVRGFFRIDWIFFLFDIKFSLHRSFLRYKIRFTIKASTRFMKNFYESINFHLQNQIAAVLMKLSFIYFKNWNKNWSRNWGKNWNRNWIFIFNFPSNKKIINIEKLNKENFPHDNFSVSLSFSNWLWPFQQFHPLSLWTW